ncbi:MAG TPA: hypothetical protein VGM53_10195 [Streptosporangiaceae bacterium]|jgi:hypothetical protein
MTGVTGVTGLIRRIRRWYGANPLHLIALIAAFALAGYAVAAVSAAGQLRGFVVWFAVAIVGHDLLLFPLYSIADLSVRRLLPRWAARPVPTAAPASNGSLAGRATAAPAKPPFINHIRVPAGLSLLLLLVWFPLILGLSSANYRKASSLSTDPYLPRWLAITGVAFLLSAVSYALRLRHAHAAARR